MRSIGAVSFRRLLADQVVAGQVHRFLHLLVEHVDSLRLENLIGVLGLALHAGLVSRRSCLAQLVVGAARLRRLEERLLALRVLTSDVLLRLRILRLRVE